MPVLKIKKADGTWISIGSKATHTLTVDEMQSHNHNPSIRDTDGFDAVYKRQFTANLHTSSDSVARGQVHTSLNCGQYAILAKTYGDIAGVDCTSNTCGSKTHSNMYSHLATYVCKQTV
jgi:hypothetical protein